VAYEEFVGKTEVAEDRLDPRLVQGLAATLDQEVPEGDVPPLWHWMLFQDWRRPSGIGPDGHPRRGGFLPPVHDLPRRMWAGGRLQWHQQVLQVGDAVKRLSRIESVTHKAGGSGRLVFVTVRHELANGRGPVLTEEHDIVYRGAEGSAVKPGAPATDWPGALRQVVLPATMPATLAAYRLDGDALDSVFDRAAGLVARNRLRHPLFAPGGVPLEVLR